jgi:hypothetical protein
MFQENRWTKLDTENILTIELPVQLDLIRQQIIKNPKKPRIVQCKNSFERMVVHRIASALGINHVTQSNYTKQVMILKNGLVRHKSGCCHECDSYSYTIIAKPKQDVLLNYSSKQPQIIGFPIMLSDSIHEYAYFGDVKRSIKRSRDYMRNMHRKKTEIVLAQDEEVKSRKPNRFNIVENFMTCILFVRTESSKTTTRMFESWLEI